jgi:hypothetical protein
LAGLKTDNSATATYSGAHAWIFNSQNARRCAYWLCNEAGAALIRRPSLFNTTVIHSNTMHPKAFEGANRTANG